jgi:hypothetical protein
MLLMSATALALPVVMTKNDGNAALTSFNSDNQNNWSPAGAPIATNTYSTVGWLLRTPTTAGNYTFAGYSLTVGGGTAGGTQPFLTNGGVNNNSFINKTPTSPIITVNNLILDAGTIRDGMGPGDTWTLAGNIFVTGNGGGFAAQGRFNIDSAINGSGKLYICDNGSDDARRTIYINSPLNTYNGNIQLTPSAGNPAGRCRLTFADNSLMNFTIGASGVNNSISGTGVATFDGDFYFNLSSASKVLGDSWTLVDNSTLTETFSDTFTVLGFTDIGGNAWLKWITPSTMAYMFNESTGILNVVVPEPATIALLGMGGLSLLRIRKRR